MNKCKGCQWYGKPYWSIINPCDNCPNENNYKTIITIDREPLFKEVLTEEEIKKAMTDKSIFETTIEEKDKEINRLNKLLDETRLSELHKEYIIEELEKYIKEELSQSCGERELRDLVDGYNLLDKLKELKEGVKDE